MPRAIWNGTVVAESDRTEVVEGNQYFPADAIRKEFFRPSATHTVCSWKGTASYYDLGGERQDEQGRRLVLSDAVARGQ